MATFRSFGGLLGEAAVETVDGAFELSRDAMIINRRGQHQHLRIPQRVVDLLHVVLLDARAVPAGMAVLAGEAAFDVHVRHVQHGDLMSRALRAGAERLRHLRGVALGPGTAVQNQNLHKSLRS